jgi:hypothetical protein
MAESFHLAYPGFDGDLYKAEHLFIREDLVVGDEVHPFFRHAIDASQITSIRHREAEVIDDSVSLCGRGFITHRISSILQLNQIYIQEC